MRGVYVAMWRRSNPQYPVRGVLPFYMAVNRQRRHEVESWHGIEADGAIDTAGGGYIERSPKPGPHVLNGPLSIPRAYTADRTAYIDTEPLLLDFA